MWPDKVAREEMIKLRDRFNIRTLVETGTAHGIGARYWAQSFGEVMSCDISEKMLEVARRKVESLPNVFLVHQPSPDFLRDFSEAYQKKGRQDTVLFLLDAHWYANWPILGELRALRDFRNCCVVIHDFKVPGLGYVSYGGQDLDLDYVKADLMAVNPHFRLYHNTREACEIVTKAEVANGLVPGLVLDEETRYVLEEIVWSSERRAYRGILYAVTEALDDSFRLVEWK